MSKSNETLYTVAFRHIAVDAKKAGIDIRDSQLNHVSTRQIRALLESAAALAPSVVFPVEPEIRITGDTGKFVVQIKGGALNFVSWSSAVKAGGKISPAQILAAISGEDGGGGPGWGRVEENHGGIGGLRPNMSIAMLMVAIVAVNAFTFWFMTRPPKTLLPKFTEMQPEPAQRLLADVAGAYETGGAPGDRRLEIRKDGGVQRIKFGAQRAPAQKQTYMVKAVEAGGKPALMTDRKSLITIKDPQSLVLFGDTYQRVMR
jgi:hypothetical protein